jgi:phosphoenolpyruvate carboxylase
MNSITVSHERAKEIFKAINGISELLKRLPSAPEDAPVRYAIMSNLTVIQMNLTGTRRANSN